MTLYKTLYMATSQNSAEKIHTLDAQGEHLGRLATRISQLLRSKNQTVFHPASPGRNFVVVKNSAKIVLTGRKETQKSYFSHSGYPSGEKHVPLSRVRDKNPGEILRRAVWGMLPPNKLRSKIIKRLKIE